MKKEYGFSLVELLVVIVVLSLLTLLIGAAVMRIISGAREDITGAQIKVIENAAEKWSVDNFSLLDDDMSCLRISTLYKGGYLTTDDVQFATGEDEAKYVIINYNETTNVYTFKYAQTEEEEESCTGVTIH